MKKILAILLAFLMVAALSACGESDEKPGSNDAAVEIILWTYPIGGWGDADTAAKMVGDFYAATGIKVVVEYLDYTTGDEKVDLAVSTGQAPDLIMESPERLVADWGANGCMADISDLIDAADKREINSAVLAACCTAAGVCYEYPLAMTVYCMAINKTVFEAAGAMEYLNAETHTWNSTEDFLKAVQAVYEYTGTTVGVVSCGSQDGDRGTRAIVNNMYGGTFTNIEHTAYTWNSPENIKALQTLRDAAGIEFDPTIAGSDEMTRFYQGTLNMAFCWDVAQQLDPNNSGTGAEKTLSGDDILFMGFPTEDGSSPELCSDIWGFGVFDNGDQVKINAAKQFIKFMCDSQYTATAVKAANGFAVRDTAEGADLSGIWMHNAIMTEYNKLVPMLGDYYQVATNWDAARFQWWNMLQEVGSGADIAAVAATRAANAGQGVAAELNGT